MRQTLVISIGPPKCGKSYLLSQFYPTENEIIIPETSLFDDSFFQKNPLSQYKTIVVDGLNPDPRTRKIIIDRISEHVRDIDKIVYILFEIDRTAFLYNIFKTNDFEYILPAILFYDALDLTKIENMVAQKIRINSDYSNNYDGVNSCVVDLRSFFLQVSTGKVSQDIPKSLDLIKINSKLCRFLEMVNEKGINIFISYCPDSQYRHISSYEVYQLLEFICANYKGSLAGVCLDLDEKHVIYNKPNPWHLFKMIEDFGINPISSFYVGVGDVDEEFCQNAGIHNFINCGNFKQMSAIDKIGHSVL